MICRGGDSRCVFKTGSRGWLHRTGQVLRRRARATFLGSQSSLVEVAVRVRVLTARNEADSDAGGLALIVADKASRGLLLRLNITWLFEFGEKLLGGL